MGGPPNGFPAWLERFRGQQRPLDDIFAFLSETFGPVRARLSKTALQALPVELEPTVVAFLSRDIVAQVKQIRAEMKDKPEYVIQRRTRDFLDTLRRRMGPLATRGIDSFNDEFGATGSRSSAAQVGF